MKPLIVVRFEIFTAVRMMIMFWVWRCVDSEDANTSDKNTFSIFRAEVAVLGSRGIPD
jgi:hypothetical protein